mmetsp:Transcript_26196/g.67592  ORF Transcript_26196/g.67592 Transcript_26196/m.67592 type:complete len:211 (-) Transcript_26196:2477-3109(-)
MRSHGQHAQAVHRSCTHGANPCTCKQRRQDATRGRGSSPVLHRHLQAALRLQRADTAPPDASESKTRSCPGGLRKQSFQQSEHIPASSQTTPTWLAPPPEHLDFRVPAMPMSPPARPAGHTSVPPYTTQGAPGSPPTQSRLLNKGSTSRKPTWPAKCRATCCRAVSSATPTQSKRRPLQASGQTSPQVEGTQAQPLRLPAHDCCACTVDP